MLSVAIGLAALVVTLLGALIVTVWKAASIVTTLSALAATMQTEIAALKAGLSALNAIPLLDQRIGHLEANHAHIPKLLSRVLVLEQQLQSLKDFKALTTGEAFRERSASRPFIPREEPENDND